MRKETQNGDAASLLAGYRPRQFQLIDAAAPWFGKKSQNVSGKYSLNAGESDRQ
jgi:hypothetical protein